MQGEIDLEVLAVSKPDEISMRLLALVEGEVGYAADGHELLVGATLLVLSLLGEDGGERESSETVGKVS